VPINPEIHKKFHTAHLEVEREYRAISLLELLREARRICDVIIDLSFYAYLTKDLETVDHLLSMVSKAKSMLEVATMHASLVIRRLKEARDILALYRYAVAIEKIIDAALDIAYISLSDHAPDKEVADSIRNLSEEIVVKIKANENLSSFPENISEEFPIDIILRVKDRKYELFFSGKIEKDDIIYIRGYRSAVNEFLKRFGYKPIEDVAINENLKGILNKIVYLFDTTKVLLDLSQLTTLMADESLAKEVDEIESTIDQYHIELLEEMVKIPPTPNNITNLSLIWLTTKLEEITDSIEEIALLSFSDKDVREVFKRLQEATGEKYNMVMINKEVSLRNAIEKVKKYGGNVLAVKKKNNWILQTRLSYGDHILLTNDCIIILYPKEFEKEIVEELEKDSVMKCKY
jgi:uncharacterized protein with PhoU and TrkA domain